MHQTKSICAVGIDIGGTNTKSIIISQDGTILHKQVQATPAHLSDIHCLYDELMTNTVNEIKGLGISIAGTVDKQNNIVINAPALNWHDLSLNDYFCQTQVPFCYLENDVNCAVIGEQFLRHHEIANNIVYLALGTGVGCALILNGTLYEGGNGFAGEIGYWRTSSATQEFNHNGFGELELKLGNHGIKERFGVDAVTLFQNSDSRSSAFINEYLNTLSVALANLISLISPDQVIIGGGISLGIKEYFPQLTNKIADITPIPFQLKISQLPMYNAAFGAAIRVLENED